MKLASEMSSKSGSKSKESFESWESLFRKTLSKDRLFNFPKPAENPIQWIHLLDSFDHQETQTSLKRTASREGLTVENSPKSGDKLPHLKFPEAVVALAQAAAKVSGESRTTGSMDLSGWPLVPFTKVQMFKCEKCCMEFCSPVNHRRHLRVIHRRAVHNDKESVRSQRQQLATFWDSLSPEETSKIVDARNLALEGLEGEKVARALSHLLQQPALFALPHSYVKSGAMLIELVQRRSSKLPLSSLELLKILDGSSEKTFPSFGLSAMQRYVFEGGAGKVGLEARNLVSTLGFLVELNLVKAFIKDKDEEAWRCQTALVEEEEASRKKRAQIQERKRLKKVRQKDSKEKEQKTCDSTMVFQSGGSESSDEEQLSDSNPASAHDLHSRPSANEHENLYCRLAGDGVDSDIHQEAVSTLMLSPSGKNYSHGEPGEADDFNLCSEAIPSPVSSALQETSARNIAKILTRVEIVASEQEAVECAANDSSTEGYNQAASGFKKPHFKEKPKYLSVRSSDGREFVPPFKKLSWKEKQNLSLRKFSRQAAAVHNVTEGVDFSSPELALENSSATRVAGFRPMQLMDKPKRFQKYLPTAQAGTAIWTKKASKHFDDTCDMSSVDRDWANGTTNSEMHDHSSSVEMSEAKMEVSAVDRSHESFFTCSEFPSSTSGINSSQQSNLATKDGGICGLDSHPPSAALVSDLDHRNEADQAGHILPSLSSVVVGSVVIGSLSISLDGPMAGQDLSNNFPVEAQGRFIIEATEGGEVTGLLCSVEKPEESFRALSENGAGNCVHHKELESNEKPLKLRSQVDTEEKENHEHPPHVGEGKSMRPTVVQAGNPKGGRVKVWRPVVSTTPHEFQGRLACAACASKNIMTNRDGKEANNPIGAEAEEHEQGQSISEADDAFLSNEITLGKEGRPTSDKGVKFENHVTEEGSNSESAIEALRLFLSQRWSAAVDASDTVVLCLEENEEWEHQAGVHSKDMEHHLRPSNNDAFSLQGRGKTVHGFWRQGCSTSAVASSRRPSGRNHNSNAAPRFAGYRYVPK